MAKLILSQDGAVLKEFRLHGLRTSIGRRAGNDIVIDNRSVSGQHAVIEQDSSGFVLNDLNSTNGTMINGIAVMQHHLRHGDVVRFGKAEFIFQVDGTVSTTRNTRVHSSVKPKIDPAALQARETDPAVAAILANTVRASQPLPEALLEVMTGSNAGRQMPLVKSATTLGKAGVQVALINRTVRGFTLMHVEGEERPRVNGRDMGLQSHTLQEGDVIDLLGVQMRFRAKA
ncbi:FHA domain-containing protein [Chitinilyticum piscinae]|uniref:FHA domain-containing protein n=1 Tax=Chitinilyticum piscinae TaxID=2866724 RepID=A0A8J7FQQ0_9NEIS|nr:FHA domain-containing protein [Chitinilyticum piscinae]MBE9608976.1 FHA domain-containing protein [Chitinilyticum piscinae]